MQMKSFRDFKKILASRPVFNNPRDDKKLGMNDKAKKKQKSLTLYGSKAPSN